MILIINNLESQIKELEKTVKKRKKFTPPKKDTLWKGSNLEVEHNEKTEQIEDVLVRLQEITDDLKYLI